MKTNVLLLMAGLVLTSCEVLVVEPRFDERDRIAGSYQIEEYSQTYNDHLRYGIYIRKAGSYSDLIIENFYDAGVDVRAEMVNDKIYIDRQFIDGFEIEGVGTVFYNEIQFNYKVRDTYANRPVDFCEATAWLD